MVLVKKPDHKLYVYVFLQCISCYLLKNMWNCEHVELRKSVNSFFFLFLSSRFKDDSCVKGEDMNWYLYSLASKGL